MKQNRFAYILSAISLFCLIIMINVISPTEAGPLGVLLFFTTLYLVIFGVACFLMLLFLRMSGKKKEMTSKDRLYAAVVSFGPIMMLMARSLGTLTIWVVLLIAFFLFLVSFLIHKKF